MCFSLCRQSFKPLLSSSAVQVDKPTRLLTSQQTPLAGYVGHVTRALQVVVVHQESGALHMQKSSTALSKENVCYFVLDNKVILSYSVSMTEKETVPLENHAIYLLKVNYSMLLLSLSLILSLTLSQFSFCTSFLICHPFGSATLTNRALYCKEIREITNLTLFNNQTDYLNSGRFKCISSKHTNNYFV